MLNDNEFVMDEALVNQSFKKALKLLDEKQKKKEALTQLETLLAAYVRMNFYLAELMGPNGDRALQDNIDKGRTMFDQFPQLKKTFHMIEGMRHIKEAKGEPFTEVESAFIRYLHMATQAGQKIHKAMKREN